MLSLLSKAVQQPRAN